MVINSRGRKQSSAEPEPLSHLPFTIVWCNAFRVPVGSLCHEELGPYFNDRLQRPRSLTRGTHDSIVMSAHAFLVFLGHLIF